MFADEFVGLSPEERKAKLAAAGRVDRENLPADVLAWLAKADEAMATANGEAPEPALVDRRTEKKAG